MRCIRLFQRGNLVGGKFHVHGCESVFEMVQLRGAYNRSRDDRLREQPRECYLSPRDAARRGDFCDAVNDLSVCLLGFAEKPFVRIVGLGADARIVPVAR
jgi:hypothetical protein